MGKRPLQGFDLAILTIFLSFYNTRLKLLDRLLCFIPVYTGPTLVSEGAHLIFLFSFICFPPLRSSLSYLVKELPSGSLPTFVLDDVVCATRGIGSIRIRSITERHSLFPQSHTYISLAVGLPFVGDV